MKYMKLALILVLSLAVLSSCGSGKGKKKTDDQVFDLQDYIEAAEQIEPTLESVDQIFDILDMVNAEYYDVLANDPYSAHSYKSDFAITAANLGIYVADVLYHYYGDNDEAMYLSFAAAQELAAHIGVQSEFGAWTLEELEGSTMKRDTLTHLFNQLLIDSEQYGSEEERVFIHTAFLTGTFIEKVHISGNLLKQKLAADEMTREEEGDIRELLVIFLNQLNPSAGILLEAFEQQSTELEGLVILTTFARLKELSTHLLDLKAPLAVAPVSEIVSNEDLKTAFMLIENLRNVIVSAQ